MSATEKNLLLCLFFFFCVSTVADSSCTGVPNNLDIYTDPPTFVKEVPNGKLFTVPQTPVLNVVHVWGTPYEMGYAQGLLLSDQITEMYTEVFEWLDLQVAPYVSNLPKDLQVAIEKYGVSAGLLWTHELTKKYTPQYFLDEIQGMADGSGVPYTQILQIAMFPEMIKAQCSMFGAWGEATADVKATLTVLRALDWGTDGPFQKHPVLTVYHPENNQADKMGTKNFANHEDVGDAGHAFATLGWTGFVGALTGYSPKMAVCEKVWLHYNGTDSREGIPWTFLLRDIIQFDNNTAQAMARVEAAPRTCSIFLGLGDHTSQTFQVVEYSHESAPVYNSTTYVNHTYWADLPYVNKHTQPSSESCMNTLLTENYGSIDPEVALRQITAVHQTGDMHIAIYDYNDNFMFVSNAGVAPSIGESGQPAYDRPFTRVDMTAAFSEQAPTFN